MIRKILVLVACVIVPMSAAVAENAANQHAILVTGASSGIGRNIAETLAEEGYYVYAGARKQEDLEELDAIDNVQALRLDVTAQADIDAAVETIRAEGRGLYGLVNNAGVLVYGPMSQAPDSDLEFVFDVNVNGVVRVTRAFAPMIIENQGRIVSTGSISGILSGPTTGVYSMSKHAVEAFTDSLAAELAPAGVHVAVVEPGNYRSKIRRTTEERTMQQMQAAGMNIGDEQRARLERAAAREVALSEPDDVSAAVLHAMFSDDPKRRYMVVPEEREAEITIRKAIEELVQLNEGHVYSYNRDELIRMLDEALSAQ